ncbi:helix-turn-helix domain-containing protein [Peptococcus niger]|uniref:HTH cro/C1-type domain-containing protein n=1 Tax=Peptococcus niger TaxID=2741 RepID=A0A1G6W4G7_PEPNI|nr:helix-turn-helix transcriptional regulator [Peptococcus niger]SDD59916.1 hypothetical protein SAMN04489866_104210 [Peptococcus niger]
MTDEEKIAICLERLNQSSIYDIADKMGYCGQTIYQILDDLPGVRGSCTLSPIPDSLSKQVIAYYFLGRTSLEISQQLDLYPGEVIDVFATLKSKKKPVVTSKYYPRVTDWLNQNRCTIKELARAINVQPNKLSSILRGGYRSHMSYKVAQKIRDYTGLSLQEIYAVQLRGRDES